MNDFKTMKIEAYQCKKCKEYIYSRARHDYKECSCKGLAVDGGHYHPNQTWIPQRIIGDLKAEYKIFDVEVTEKELYTDWNDSKNEYGVIK